MQAMLPFGVKSLIWKNVLPEIRAKKIYSIKITDYTGSMTLKIIDDVANCRPLDMLKKGSAILTRGEIEYDKYDREIVCRARGIATVELLQVVDQAEEKRGTAFAYQYVQYGWYQYSRRFNQPCLQMGTTGHCHYGPWCSTGISRCNERG